VTRSQVFAQRHRIYSQLDAKLAARTRFFGAAALTNAVLAELFRFLPGYALNDAYHLLSEAGTLLETANVQFAHDLEVRAGRERELDRSLVCREQGLLQSFLNARMAGTCQWWSIRAQLNRLLNEQHYATLGSGLLSQCRQYGAVLRSVRTRLAVPLDFALESHRVDIGVGIIRYIRQEL
jgi:hypothetical protein